MRTILNWTLGILGILLLVIAPFWLNDSPYLMHIAISAFFYAILASSWSLLAGYAGQFSFGHMAFMAIGAYTAALFGYYIKFTTAPTNECTEFALGGIWLVILNPIGVSSIGGNCLEVAKQFMADGTVIIKPPLWVGLILGIAMGGLFGLLVGWLVLRLRSTYLALFTIGFSEILRAAISSELAVTQGQSGFEMDPLFPNGLDLLGYSFGASSKVPPYYVMLILFLICMGIMAWLTSSRFGLFIRAIREDEEAAAALGVHVVRYKIRVFVITAMMAAAAGVIQGHYIGIVTPNILVVLQMSLVIAMAVIGGLESIVAAAIGALVIQTLLELLRNSFDIGPIEVDMTTWRLVWFGAVLMLTLRFQRNGLIYPIINWITRGNVAAETVSKRTGDTEGDAGLDEIDAEVEAA